jgi:hypothetical protein
MLEGSADIIPIHGIIDDGAIIQSGKAVPHIAKSAVPVGSVVKKEAVVGRQFGVIAHGRACISHIVMYLRLSDNTGTGLYTNACSGCSPVMMDVAIVYPQGVAIMPDSGTCTPLENDHNCKPPAGIC